MKIGFFGNRSVQHDLIHTPPLRKVTLERGSIPHHPKVPRWREKINGTFSSCAAHPAGELARTTLRKTLFGYPTRESTVPH